MGGNRKRTGVTPISKTSIQITFTYKGCLCRERLRLQPSPSNLKKAEYHRGAILDAISKGQFDYSVTFPDSPRRFQFEEQKAAGLTLEYWLETWLERQEQHLKSSTLDDYRKIVFNTLIPAIGTHFLHDLRRSHVREMCDKMLNVSNKRLANVQSVLRSSLQEALDDELIEINPMFGWKYARRDAPRKEDDVDPFSEVERELILCSCREPQHRNLFKFAFWSGFRTSELAALEWGDIDWLNGIVYVRRAKTQAADKAEGTKTRKGTRAVKLLSPALEALIAQKAHSFLAGGAVFLNPRTMEPWAGDQPIRHGAWVPALRKSGVRYRRPYQTRHTYASMMLTAGESPIWLAQQMGHSDTTMIFKIYGRWIPDATPDAGDKAVEMFNKNAALKLHNQG